MPERPKVPKLGSAAKKKKETVSSREQRTALVLGGTGSFGAAIINEHLQQGRPVRACVRDIPAAVSKFGSYTKATFHEGDVFDEESILEAARGCQLIYHAVSFPLHQMDPNSRIAMQTVLSVAKKVGAAVVFPGNVWGLGKQHDTRLSEDAEMQAESKKGRLRIELEGMLEEAAKRGDSRALILRAGDFFGPTVRNTGHDAIFGNAMAGKPMIALGSLDAPHQWAFLPDLARVCLKMSDAIERLSPFETIHFAGHEFASQQAFFDKVIECAEDPALKIKKMSWLTIRGASIANKQMRELLELRHLWDKGVLLDDTRLRRVWPKFQLTPIDSAIAQTLISYR